MTPRELSPWWALAFGEAMLCLMALCFWILGG